MELLRFIVLAIIAAGFSPQIDAAGEPYSAVAINGVSVEAITSARAFGEADEKYGGYASCQIECDGPNGGTVCKTISARCGFVYETRSEAQNALRLKLEARARQENAHRSFGFSFNIEARFDRQLSSAPLATSEQGSQSQKSGPDLNGALLYEYEARGTVQKADGTAEPILLRGTLFSPSYVQARRHVESILHREAEKVGHLNPLYSITVKLVRDSRQSELADVEMYQVRVKLVCIENATGKYVTGHASYGVEAESEAQARSQVRSLIKPLPFTRLLRYEIVSVRKE